MGRNYEFNKEEILTKSMEVFWQKGYKATSIKDIIDITGLQPGSIYNTFGDKHSLFIAAVEHYGNVITTNANKTLKAGGSPIENIKKFFEEITNRPMDKRCNGCLIVNTVVELAPHDNQTARVVKNILKKIEAAFYDCLERAVEMGEISPDTNIEALSRYFASSTHGVLVTGKTKASKKEMDDIVNVILSTLN